MSVINTDFSKPARIFQYLINKELYSSSNKIEKVYTISKLT